MLHEMTCHTSILRIYRGDNRGKLKVSSFFPQHDPRVDYVDTLAEAYELAAKHLAQFAANCSMYSLALSELPTSPGVEP